MGRTEPLVCQDALKGNRDLKDTWFDFPCGQYYNSQGYQYIFSSLLRVLIRLNYSYE